MSRFTHRHVSLTLEDGTGTPLTFAVGPGPGDMSVSEVNASNKEVIRVLNRGAHDGFVDGDDMVQDVSISIAMPSAALTSGSVGTAMDFFRKQGTYAAGVSLDATIWAFKAKVVISDGTTTANIEYPLCEGALSWAEAKEGNTISIGFRNYVTPVVT